MEHKLKGALIIGVILICGNIGIQADDPTQLDCSGQSFPIWPPHDELECHNPIGEKIWPPSDYIDVPELGFYKFYKIGTNWHTANTICQEDGAHLVIINSESESALLRQLTIEHKDVLGADAINHVWLGIHERGVHGKFFTIFGDPVEVLGYTVPWVPGNPNDVGLDDCASIFETGVLFDDPWSKKYPFVCEIEHSTLKVVEKHPSLYHVPETLCNGQTCHGNDGTSKSIYWTDLDSPNTPNWSSKDYLVDCKGNEMENAWPPSTYTLDPAMGSYYKVHLFGTNWYTAVNTCEQEGAHLLLINSWEEAAAINVLINKYPAVIGSANKDHVWVGVHERGTHGQFKAVFGEPLEALGFMPWSQSPPQPNDAGLDDCVSYHKSTTLYDDACLLSYHFICEIEVSAVELLRNISTHRYIPSPVCNDRTCPGSSKLESREDQLIQLAPPKLDVRSILVPKTMTKPTPKPTPRPRVSKPPKKHVSPSPAVSEVQSDSGYEDPSEYESLIKSLVLKTNYTGPDLYCQQIPLDFNGGLCRSSGCSSRSASCSGRDGSVLMHSVNTEKKPIKAILAPNKGSMNFPGKSGLKTTPLKRKPTA